MNYSSNGQPESQLTSLPRALTMPLSWIYGLGRRGDRFIRTCGLIPRFKLPVPVICIGNLTVGGTGKTPFVQSMALALKDMGYRPAILSRGYQAVSPPAKPFIVSDGSQVHGVVESAGDEPLLLANICPGIPVVVHPDRFAAGLTAVHETGADCLVLDDGFQHDRLERDLDIVLWDAGDVPRLQKLLPAGRLREGLGALRRADVLVLTHAEYIPEADRVSRVTQVLSELKRVAPAVPVFDAIMTMTGSVPLSMQEPDAGKNGEEPRNWPWSDRRVILVSGLARPEGFEQMIQRSGASVVDHFIYGDHADYTSRQIEQWRDRRRALNAELIVTTSKDAVKIAQLDVIDLPIHVAQIRMEVGEKSRWQRLLEQHAPAGPSPGSTDVHGPESVK